MSAQVAADLRAAEPTHTVRHIYHRRCQDPLTTQSALCGHQRPGPGVKPFTGFGPDRCIVCTDLAMAIVDSDSWDCQRCPTAQPQSGNPA